MGITDIIFFVIISVFMMIFIHIANSGNVRWYIYVMALLGFISYYKTLGKVVISLSLPLVYYIKKAVSSALNTVSYPIRILIVRIKLKLKSRPKKEIKDENTSRNVLLRTGK
jgi:predicted membrane protein